MQMITRKEKKKEIWLIRLVESLRDKDCPQGALDLPKLCTERGGCIFQWEDIGFVSDSQAVHVKKKSFFSYYSQMPIFIACSF